MQRESEPAPTAGHRVLCRHPFLETKRVYVVPAKVVTLYEKVWDRENGAKLEHVTRNGDQKAQLDQARSHLKHQMDVIREDHLRGLNPTPYKVSVSEELYDFLHSLMEKEAPIKEIS